MVYIALSVKNKVIGPFKEILEAEEFLKKKGFYFERSLFPLWVCGGVCAYLTTLTSPENVPEDIEKWLGWK